MICTILLHLFQVKNKQFWSTFKSLSDHRPKGIVPYRRIIEGFGKEVCGELDEKLVVSLSKNLW
jgi:hypothetical protein